MAAPAASVELVAAPEGSVRRWDGGGVGGDGGGGGAKSSTKGEEVAVVVVVATVAVVVVTVAVVVTVGGGRGVMVAVAVVHDRTPPSPSRWRRRLCTSGSRFRLCTRSGTRTSTR